MIKSDDQDTRAKIFEAAMDCFSERGFKGTTTRAIAERAGVNLALVSYHWGGKAELWGSVVRELNDRLASIATAAVCEPMGADLSASIATFLRRVVRELLADPRPIRVMAWAQLSPEGFDPAVVEHAYGPAVRAGMAYLKSAQQAGIVPAHVDVELALVTYYGLLAEPLVEPAVHRHLFGRDRSDADHAARLERHLVHSGLALLGLSAPEGMS